LNEKLKKTVPWYLKIFAKFILARLPIPYAFWKRLGIFEAGDMAKPQAALDIFVEHFRLGKFLNLKSYPSKIIARKKDFTLLEIGPGDSVSTAMIAKTLGASRSWLVDAGHFATSDMDSYMRLSGLMNQKGMNQTFMADCSDFTEMLERCHCEYLTEGVYSLSKIPSNSVDFCFSNAVLEHIPKKDFSLLIAELFRVLKSDGVCVHRVDLKDHLAEGLNNLRFSERIWEGLFSPKSGFYTNRIRYEEMVALFKNAGFDCQTSQIIKWNKLPLARAKMSGQFRDLPEENLLVSGFDMVLRRKAKASRV
jgi:SAM-dependent methyltransferase